MEHVGMIVDVHVHVFPPGMFEAVWKYFEDRDWDVHHEHVDDIARSLRKNGVEIATGLSYPHKPGVAGSLNGFMASIGRRNPIFRPFASVHVDDPDLRDQVDYAIASPYLHGFKFQPLVQEFDMNDPRLDYLYASCREADFPLLIHAGDAPLPSRYVGFSHFRRLMRRFPELRVCVAHMGGSEFDRFLEMLDDHPLMFMDTAMINTTTDLFDNAWNGDEKRLAGHSDRICFGSDWPNVPYPYQEALDSVVRFPFPPGARSAVMGANACRYLKMETSPNKSAAQAKAVAGSGG